MKAKTILIDSLPTVLGTLYTVPPNTRAKWVLAFVVNSTGATIGGVNIKISNSEIITVIGAKSLTSGEHIELKQDGGYVMLEAGYSITGIANATGVSAILTFEETSQIVSTA